MNCKFYFSLLVVETKAFRPASRDVYGFNQYSVKDYNVFNNNGFLRVAADNRANRRVSV